MRMNFFKIGLLAAGLVLLLTQITLALAATPDISPDIIDQLLDSDGEGGDQFGYSVSVSGDVAIIGAPDATTVNRWDGAAFIFTRTGGVWSQIAKLLADDGATQDRFGSAVAVSGTIALVSASGKAVDGEHMSGAVYVFALSNSEWMQTDILVPYDLEYQHYFGRSLGFDGQTAVIGAPGDSSGGRNSGAAYVFRLTQSGWTQMAKLRADDGAHSDMFGCAVATTGDMAVVGAPYHFVDGSQTGAIYVFTRSNAGWTQAEKIVSLDIAAGDNFGSSVSMHADTLVIGAPGDDDDGTGAGSAYIFTNSATGWAQTGKLTADDDSPVSGFGQTVSVNEDIIVVGGRFHDDHYSPREGLGFIFTRVGETWAKTARLADDEGRSFLYTGRSVAAAGDTVLVGAYGSSSPGRVYVFGETEATSDLTNMVPIYMMLKLL